MRPQLRLLLPKGIKGTWPLYSRTASSPHHLYGAVLPPFCPEGPYLVLPVSGSTTLRMMLCLASHSSFVIGFIAWMRDFCSSVRTGRCPLFRAVLEGHCSVPTTSSQEHSIDPGGACGLVTNHAREGLLDGPKALPGWYCCVLSFGVSFSTLQPQLELKTHQSMHVAPYFYLVLLKGSHSGGRRVGDCSVHSSATTPCVDPTRGTGSSFSPLQCFEPWLSKREM